MKILVAFYSKTGRTKKVANMIAAHLNADIEEISEIKNRGGKIGSFFSAGKDALLKKTSEIKKTAKDPSDYDVVVIGSPTWVGNICPAIRTYLKENKFKKVAFFITHGGGPGKILSEMEKLGGKPIATLEVRDKKVENKISKENIEKFCEKINLIRI